MYISSTKVHYNMWGPLTRSMYSQIECDKTQ